MTSPETTILMIRHGQTEWNVSRKVMGKLPIPLDTFGIEQADGLRQALAALCIEAIYHSPHLRTTETAQKIAEAHRHLTLLPHAALAEVDYGSWEGQSFTALRSHEAFALYFSEPAACEIPGGERLTDVQTRIVGFIDSLQSPCAGKNVVLVTHSDVIKAALVHYLDLPLNAIHRLRIDNGSVSVITLAPTTKRVIAVNHAHSLAALFKRGLRQ